MGCLCGLCLHRLNTLLGLRLGRRFGSSHCLRIDRLGHTRLFLNRLLTGCSPRNRGRGWAYLHAASPRSYWPLSLWPCLARTSLLGAVLRAINGGNPLLCRLRRSLCSLSLSCSSCDCCLFCLSRLCLGHSLRNRLLIFRSSRPDLRLARLLLRCGPLRLC